MRLYIAGPMRGYPEFNFPAFHRAAADLRALGHTVFSPAEKDIEREGMDISKGNKEGSEEMLDKQLGLPPGAFLRVALGEDLDWICKHADGVALLGGWETSKGAIAESSTANALGLRRFIEVHETWLEIDAHGRIMGNSLGPVEKAEWVPPR